MAEKIEKNQEDDQRKILFDDEMQTSTKTLALRAPKIHTSIQRLCSQTLNLNNAPENWLRSTPFDNLDGFHAKGYTTETRFSSLRMAFDHLHMHPDVNVVTAANNIKKLLTLALTNSQGLSMFVHPVGKSLLIDNFDIHKWLLNPNPEWKWLRDFFFTEVLGSKEDLNKAIMRRNHTNDALIERSWMSKFLYYSLPAQASLLYNEVTSADEPKKDETSSSSSEILNEFPSLPNVPRLPKIEAESNLEGSDFNDANIYSHARTLLWNFKDLKMLIGSDMPIFGDKDHPSVSLKLVNLKKPINILTGLDYWLDNLMCQVPEVLMCFHDEGIVKNYEIFKTEDLPNLGPHARFNVDSVMQVAMNILAFLKRNATKEGHTYWLFKRKNDNVVKLYDLTSLCASEMAKMDSSEPAQDSDKQTTSSSPFQDAVCMLLYKLARNILKTKGKEADDPILNIGDESAIARRALNNCLKLLNKEKYPQISASASYLLSDIYVPDDTNPLNPNFSSNNIVIQPKDKPKESSRKSKKKGKNKRGKNEKMKENHVKNVTIEELKEDEEESNEDDIEIEPLPSDVETRCNLALQHISDGLESVKYLQMKKEEIEEQRQKAQEQHERDNPKMCRPNEPIPMPYKKPNQELEKFEAHKKVSDWHDNLKALLLRKAFLVYLTLAEAHFSKENYGKCVKLLKRALNCHFGFLKMNEENGKVLVSFAYGVAGDAFMILAEKWEDLCVKFHEGFNFEGADNVDSAIANTIEDLVDEYLRDWTIKVPKDLEESLTLAVKCFKASKDVLDQNGDEESKNNLLARYGNALNVSATLNIRKATSLLETPYELQDIEVVLKQAIHLLDDGIQCFCDIKNWMNAIILATNAGMAYRTLAYAYKNQLNNVDQEAEIHDLSLTYYDKAFQFANNEEIIVGAAHNLLKAVIYSINELFPRNQFFVLSKMNEILTNVLESSAVQNDKIFQDFADIGGLLVIHHNSLESEDHLISFQGCLQLIALELIAVFLSCLLDSARKLRKMFQA